MKLGQVLSFLDVGLVPEEYRERVPAQARRAARRGAEGLASTTCEGDRVRARRADRGGLRRVRRGADRRGLDRPGLPRAAARRARGRGQGPVPGRRGRGAGRHAEPRDDPPADEAGGARARRQGDRRRDPRPDRGGARLRARGPEPALARAHLPRPPVHRRPRRRSTSLSREKVIVTEFVARPRLRGDQGARPGERDRIGEIVFRFYFGCMYRHHQFSGDPHPGNFMLLDDGRMAFLDFGLFKRDPEGARSSSSSACQRARHEGDGERPASSICAESGFIADPDRFRPEQDARAVRRRHVVVHARRGDRARARDRHRR